jgi:hypothetical protein
MNTKRNKSNNVFITTNDAAKGTRKWWKQTLEYDVYKLGLTYEQVKEKYNYGKYKPYWLSTNWWRKRFDEAYVYWEQKRIADKDADTYSGYSTGAETDAQKKSNLVDYLIYGLIGLLVLLVIWAIVRKK